LSFQSILFDLKGRHETFQLKKAKANKQKEYRCKYTEVTGALTEDAEVGFIISNYLSLF